MNKEFLPTISAFALVIIMLGVGLYLTYEIDTAINYNFISNQIKTNQTFVNEQSCEKIKLSIEALKLIWSPTQQENVNKLKENFENIAKEKECLND